MDYEIQQSLKKCLKGKHDLIEIHRSSYSYDENIVVRWCRICGSVVVDIEYDGRIDPGGVMKMLGPKISKEFI
ncbi:hypothetical protein KAW18_03715 [candidate division WOR-3 bacterium]|nr:hypothetical protein [Candidatus Parcubacteria bacterium]MCK4526454.1 hypothetical protein [candidate division WOR-3 bacterium]